MKAYCQEIIRQADAGVVSDEYLALAPAAREIASVMAKHYDRYAAQIWPDEKRVLEDYIARVTGLFEQRRFTGRAEELLGCRLPTEAFYPSMVMSVSHGADAIDTSEARDVFGIDLSPGDSFLFIGHEFIIYLLKHALRDEDALRHFETWEMTEAPAEYCLKELMGQYLFTGMRDRISPFYRLAENGRRSTADLYRTALLFPERESSLKKGVLS